MIEKMDRWWCMEKVRTRTNGIRKNKVEESVMFFFGKRIGDIGLFEYWYIFGTRIKTPRHVSEIMYIAGDWNIDLIQLHNLLSRNPFGEHLLFLKNFYLDETIWKSKQFMKSKKMIHRLIKDKLKILINTPYMKRTKMSCFLLVLKFL